MESKNVVMFSVIFVLLVVGVFSFIYFFDFDKDVPKTNSEVNSFSSYEELFSYINKSVARSNNYYNDDVMIRNLGFDRMAPEMATMDSAPASKGLDYSETNIQVEGVDEADIVKTDGEFIYYVVGNSVYIFRVYPSDDLELLGNISFNGYVSEIFLNDNLLVVFANEYSRNNVGTDVFIYDIRSRENPILYEEYSFEGYYLSSRMIGDYVYVISTKYLWSYDVQPIVYYQGGLKTEVDAREIYYFDYPESNYVFNVVSSINLNNKESQTKVFLTGYSGVIYSSNDNIYLSSSKNIALEDYFDRFIDDVVEGLLPKKELDKIKVIVDNDDYFYVKDSRIRRVIYEYSSSLRGEEKEIFDSNFDKRISDFELSIAKEREKTVFHKIKIDEGDIEYVSSGEVSGRVLNQFSMDEYDGYFRVVTTTGSSWRDTSLNHLYVLDKDMKIVGSVEDLAKGERIYSARFIGDMAYMVTFKDVDPLFVIDLSKPNSPEVLGYLKIPGFSSYLHSIDENNLLGIGMDVDEKTGRMLGLKVAIFDVSDFENPREKYNTVIDKQLIYSEALHNHKAILLDIEKNILAIPVDYYEPTEDRYYYSNSVSSVFVFNLDSAEFIGEIELVKEENSWDHVNRVIYIENLFYTLSNKVIQVNDFYNLRKVNSLVFREDGYFYYPMPIIREVSEDFVEVLDD